MMHPMYLEQAVAKKVEVFQQIEECERQENHHDKNKADGRQHDYACQQASVACTHHMSPTLPVPELTTGSPFAGLTPRDQQ